MTVSLLKLPGLFSEFRLISTTFVEWVVLIGPPMCNSSSYFPNVPTIITILF